MAQPSTGAGYDISASISTSSAANPVAQFGNVYGGGRNKDWWIYLLVGAAVVAAVWVLWRKR